MWAGLVASTCFFIQTPANIMSEKSRFRIDEIRAKFWEEFSPLDDRFDFEVVNLKEARDEDFDEPYRPGVYVIWNDRTVYKVGRHLSDARMRALQHFTDNTSKDGIEISSIENDPNTRLLLFLVNKKEDETPDDLHWVMALEDYLEQVLYPEIPAGRRG